jgi:hypothetical protein
MSMLASILFWVVSIQKYGLRSNHPSSRQGRAVRLLDGFRIQTYPGRNNKLEYESFQDDLRGEALGPYAWNLECRCKQCRPRRL